MCVCEIPQSSFLIPNGALAFCCLNFIITSAYVSMVSFNLVEEFVSCQTICFENLDLTHSYTPTGTMKNICRKLIC